MRTCVRICSLLLALALVFCAVSFAADSVQKKIEYDYTPTEPVNPDSLVSDALNIIDGTGLPICWISNHGGGQTRMVYTTTGAYFCLFTASDPAQDPLPFDLIHIKDDGTTESVFHSETAYRASGPMISVMADKNGTVWFYAGYDDMDGTKHYYDVTVWKYTPADGKTQAFNKKVFYSNKFNLSDGGGGYSNCCLDEDNHRIFAIVNIGNKPGYSEWLCFDTQTETWSDFHNTKLDYRYCYTYILPDGNGGYHIFNQRDVTVEAIKTDIGKNVGVAGRQLHSNWYDNNMLFDEWDYFHISDPYSDGMDAQFAVEPAVYEAAKGLYPDCRADSSDIFMDKDGYLHFIYHMEESVSYGHRNVHVVYDPKDNMKEIRRQTFNFAGSSNINYLCRMYQDTVGNFYVIAIREDSVPIEIEVWAASDSTAELKLVHQEIGEENDRYYTGTAIGTLRNGSIMNDTIHMGGYTNHDEWFYFTIDLAQVRAFMAEKN